MKRLLTVLAVLGSLSAAVAAARSTFATAVVGLPAPAATHHPPDILLVTIDALRADHLSSYGYPLFTSPTLDAFARHAVRFTNAIAQAPYTKASVASIMTGQYPSGHKTVTASVPFAETMTGHLTTVPIATDVLPSSMTTLAQAVRSAGYQTQAFTANPFLIEAFGFARGFDRFRFYPGPDFADSDRLVADAIDAARDSDSRRPLFTWVHVMEPHSPYTPPRLTTAMFPVSGPAQPIPLQVAIPGWLLPGSPRDRRLYLAAYDEDVAAVDVAVDTLVREFRTMRAWRDTIVVVTADHGEQFLDHGGWEHGTNLYDELIRVPLLIQAPKSAPGVVDAQVQLIDLFPTLASIVGAAVPKDRPIDGVDQSSFFTGKSEKSAREGILIWCADRLQAVKWRNFKVHFYQQETMVSPPIKLAIPLLFNLYTNPREDADKVITDSWIFGPVLKMIGEFDASVKKNPLIAMGTPDPYTSPR